VEENEERASGIGQIIAGLEMPEPYDDDLWGCPTRIYFKFFCASAACFRWASLLDPVANVGSEVEDGALASFDSFVVLSEAIDLV